MKDPELARGPSFISDLGRSNREERSDGSRHPGRSNREERSDGSRHPLSRRRHVGRDSCRWCPVQLPRVRFVPHAGMNRAR